MVNGNFLYLGFWQNYEDKVQDNSDEIFNQDHFDGTANLFDEIQYNMKYDKIYK